MIFIDASAYIALLVPTDNLHQKALQLANGILTQSSNHITSYGILGEVLTVGSQRHNRQAAIDFVENVLDSKTHIIIENEEFLKRSFKIFQDITDKNVSWIDCYSFAIIEYYKIEKVFSFDKDFKKYSKAEVL